MTSYFTKENGRYYIETLAFEQNETAVWAAQAQAERFGTQLAAQLPDDPAFAMAESIRALLMGDVVQRVVAVDTLAHERSYAETAESQLWAVPFLLLAMEDNYPAIRFMWASF